MNHQKFWETIQVAIDSQSATQADYLAILDDEVAQLPLDEIVKWHIYFESYLAFASKEKVWAGAFVLNKGECDDEQFDSFCAWLISMGKDYYLTVLAEVDSLGHLQVAAPDRYRATFEELLYLASDIYVRKVCLQPFMNPASAEGQFLNAVATNQLTDEELFELRKEIKYESDINRVWNERRLERLRHSLPLLTEKYLPFLDKNALKYQPNTDVPATD